MRKFKTSRLTENKKSKLNQSSKVKVPTLQVSKTENIKQADRKSSRRVNLGRSATLKSNASCGSMRKKQKLEYPLSPREVLSALKDRLMNSELREIMGYARIYYIGPIQSKSGKFNGGWDDEKGDCILSKGSHIAYRYEVLSILGEGSFGKVVKAFDHKAKETVALKILRNRDNIRKQSAVEISIMKLINSNDPQDEKCLIRLKNHFEFRKHVCIVMELLHINLYQLMKASQFQGFSLDLIKRFTIQLLKALKFTEELEIIHCDIKPENIVLRHKKRSAIKLIDFGTSCFISTRCYTYIQSRYYRAPEIILGIPYTTKIDIWSLGCMLYEFYEGMPLFPGKDEVNLLKHIMALKGVPPVSLLCRAKRAKHFFDEEGNPTIYNASDKLLPGMRNLDDLDPLFRDFVSKCLEWSNRPSANELLAHPWLIN